jgi:hypothetical protein
MSNCTLKVTEVSEGILHVEAETQYELASTFMRVQEFYESPYGDIRGQYFSHEQYMDYCAYGNKRSAVDKIIFSYLEDWNGFNVPGDVFDEWASLFAEHYLWDKEKKLIELVNKNVNTAAYYIIGTHHEAARGDFDHELSHAWYYLDSKYQELQQKNLDKLSEAARRQLRANILNDGYQEDVLKDEMIAYLSTNLMPDTKEMFDKVRVPWTTVYEFQQTFTDYKETHFDQDN